MEVFNGLKWVPSNVPSLLSDGALAFEHMDVYLDSVNGDDSKNGLTTGTKLKTVSRMLDLSPAYYRKHLSYNFAPGKYVHSSDDPKNTGAIELGALIGGNATFPTLIGGFDSIFGDLTVNAVSVDGSTVSDTTQPTAGDLYQHFLKCISSVDPANVGQMVTVVGNDLSGTFKINSAFPSPLQIGDKFQILYPNVNIHLVGNMVFIGENLGINGILFTSEKDANGIGDVAFLQKGIVNFEGVVVDLIDGGSLNISHYANLSTGHAFAWKNADPNPFSDKNYAAGLCVKNGDCSFSYGKAGFIYAVFDKCFVEFDSSQSVFTNPFARNCQLDLFFNSYLGIVNDGTIRSVFDNCQILIDDQSNAGLNALDFHNCADDCIRIIEGGFARILDVQGTAADGNLGYGITVDGICGAEINDTILALFGGDTSVSGAKGDVLVGSTPKTYAEIGGAVDSIAAAPPSTTTTLELAGGGLVVNQFAGSEVFCNGEIVGIASNTANQLTLFAPGLSAAPASTDFVAILGVGYEDTRGNEIRPSF